MAGVGYDGAVFIFPSLPRLIVTCLVLALLFALLCGPSLFVALRLRRRGDRGALRPLRVIWFGQVMLASVLILAADAAGLSNPIGCVLAILFAVSASGAVVLVVWRLILRWRVR